MNATHDSCPCSFRFRRAIRRLKRASMQPRRPRKPHCVSYRDPSASMTRCSLSPMIVSTSFSCVTCFMMVLKFVNSAALPFLNRRLVSQISHVAGTLEDSQNSTTYLTTYVWKRSLSWQIAFRCSGRSPSMPPEAQRSFLDAVRISVGVGHVSIEKSCGQSSSVVSTFSSKVGFWKSLPRYLPTSVKYSLSVFVKTPGRICNGVS